MTDLATAMGLNLPELLLVIITTIALAACCVGVYFAWRDGHFSKSN